MFAMPDAGQLVELAASLNLYLSRRDAGLYLPFIRDAMHELDTFVQSRTDAAARPWLFPERGLGYRASLAWDRYQTWLWKCAIGGQDRGLLAGKTVSFKDHMSVAGIRQVFTSQVLEGFIPDVDATVVSLVLSAGGKIVGKHMMNGFTSDYGKPLNPHNPARITGGSSSGSGAALAAGEVDISFGGGQGGSIRLPDAYCGVVRLKPTFGLVSHFAVGFAAEPQRGSRRTDGAHCGGRRGGIAGGGRIRRQRSAPAPRHPREHRRVVRPGRRREGTENWHPRRSFFEADRAGGRRRRPGGCV